ncbi:MAG: cyclodeaminase/cyclohydrolase family protein [Deltaproteobacteria bacterium]|jgi:formiminotetrahydrofolate cyclodeaminase|nr:cyclodeaminase/cyclohydrolase family protein [Deltaproteobacteria bacterium]
MSQEKIDPSAYFKMPFGDFLEAAASRSHVPGGGCAAAAAGALGAAMAAMVANLTVGKKGCEDHEAGAREMAALFGDGVSGFQELGAGDVRAFDAVMGAMRLPRATPEERGARGAALRGALLGAVGAPAMIAGKAAGLLKATRSLAAFGNAGAVNDCGVAAVLLEAAVRAAVLSAEVNLPGLGGAEGVELPEELRDSGAFLAEAEAVMRETLEIVVARRS